MNAGYPPEPVYFRRSSAGQSPEGEEERIRDFCRSSGDQRPEEEEELLEDFCRSSGGQSPEVADTFPVPETGEARGAEGGIRQAQILAAG